MRVIPGSARPVGVCDVQRAHTAYQLMYDASSPRWRRRVAGTTQVERVAGDQQVGAGGECLRGDLFDAVDGKQHPAYVGGWVSADQAAGIPGLREPSASSTSKG